MNKVAFLVCFLFCFSAVCQIVNWPVDTIDSKTTTTMNSGAVVSTGYLQWDSTGSPSKQHIQIITDNTVIDKWTFISPTSITEYSNTTHFCVNATYDNQSSRWPKCTKWTSGQIQQSTCSYVDDSGPVMVTYDVTLDPSGRITQIESTQSINGAPSVTTIVLSTPSSIPPNSTAFNIPKECSSVNASLPKV